MSRARWFAAVTVLAVVVATIASQSTPGGRDDEPAAAAAAPRHIPDSPRRVPDPGAAGRIDSASVSGTTATLTGWALDLTEPDNGELRVSIDDEFARTVPTGIARPDVDAAWGRGSDHGFSFTIDIPDGPPVSVCLHTAATDALVTCRRVAPESWPGVLITRRGIMVEILEVRDDGYLVQTPCGNRDVVSGGQQIRTTQILIDPGHGGSEVASVGPNGLAEKALNLDVAKRAAERLQELGYEAELTRTRDIRIPIATRAGLANALRPDLFLSLHHNGGATGRQSVPGTQVYYQHDDREARRVGGIVYEELFAAASDFPTSWVGNSKDGVSTRLNGRGTDFYGIHRRTPEVTSLITEFLWLSNGPEARLLERDAVRDAEATALARGIDRWYRSEHSGSGFIPDFVDNFDSGGGGFEGCVDPKL